MAVVTELTGALEWMRAQIAADATIQAVSGYGGCFKSLAPKGTTAPYIILDCLSPLDVLTANGNRVYQNQLWQAKAIGPASGDAGLITLALRLDALFGNVRQAGDANVAISASVREAEVDYTEDVDGEIWWHLGGHFRIETILK